jgi:hypothetical protein
VGTPPEMSLTSFRNKLKMEITRGCNLPSYLSINEITKRLSYNFAKAIIIKILNTFSENGNPRLSLSKIWIMFLLFYFGIPMYFSFFSGSMSFLIC